VHKQEEKQWSWEAHPLEEPVSLEQLLKDIGEGLSQEERKTILETGALTAEGATFAFAAGDDGSLYVYCDFGDPPREHALASLKRLLEINLFLYGNGTPSFAINPLTGRVMLACRMSGNALKANGFANSLRVMASYVRQWRATHFLVDDENIHSELRSSMPPQNNAFSPTDSARGL
jgi:Tir chaperone family protein CesT